MIFSTANLNRQKFTSAIGFLLKNDIRISVMILKSKTIQNVCLGQIKLGGFSLYLCCDAAVFVLRFLLKVLLYWIIVSQIRTLQAVQTECE